MSRRLVLHIGAMKTGTSYLQASFARNDQYLTSQGILYAASGWAEEQRHLAKGWGVTPGNGVEVAKFLNPSIQILKDFDRPTATAAMTERLAALQDGQSLLYSSEYMSVFLPARLQELRKLVESSGCQMFVVYYVRPIYDYLMSLYSQTIKRTDATLSFEEFMATPQSTIKFRDRVDSLAQTLDPSMWALKNYDTVQERGDIFKDFCTTVLGINIDGLTIEPERVNRALTASELDVMMRIKKFYISSDVKKNMERHAFVSDSFIYGDTGKDTAATVDPKVLALIKSRYDDDVRHINKYLGPDDQLGLVSRKLEQAEGTASEKERFEEALLAVLAGIVKKIV